MITLAKHPIDKSFLRTQLIDYNDTIINPQLEKLDTSIKKNATDIANFSHGTSKVAAAHHADSATTPNSWYIILYKYKKGVIGYGISNKS